jgi:DNA-binding LacI/PurR family transcriptional regulator
MKAAMEGTLDDLRRLVEARAGRRLPGERELAAELAISRPRLRQWLDLLESEGRVRRQQGSGTYAVRAGDDRLTRIVFLLDDSFKLGDDPFVSNVVEQLQSTLTRANCQCFIARGPQGENAVPRHDAVVAMGFNSLGSLAELPWKARPSVGLFSGSTAKPTGQTSQIQLEDEDAGRLAGRRLLELGCRRALFFGWTGIPAAAERFAGARDELAEAGVQLDLVESGLNYVAGLEAAVGLKPTELKGTGLIAANDWLAIGLHTGLASAHPGVRPAVPLIGFDGLPLARRPELAIQSLAIPLESIVADTVAELQRLYAGGGGRALRYPLSWT